ncbi:MAG: hypothetical protein KGS44_04710 [Alphaproteobacteria bacterium]|nr:hypothetical protein [Alphaproteobacteria bacterium]
MTPRIASGRIVTFADRHSHAVNGHVLAALRAETTREAGAARLEGERCSRTTVGGA